MERTAIQWPPSPSVEDEEAALAREHDVRKSVVQVKNENQPAGNRGSVDQYPIILDVDLSLPTSSDDAVTDNDRESDKSHSSDESLGPPTPTQSNVEKRFVYIPKKEPQAGEKTKPLVSTSQSSQEPARGRPQVSRIQTDLGADLHEAITGQRRAPSPYAYKPAQTSDKAEHGNRFSGEFLLAPGHAKLPVLDHKRAASARPHVRADGDSSTDSDRRPERRRHHSRKRSTRESFATAQAPRSSEPAQSPRHNDPVASYSTPIAQASFLTQASRQDYQSPRSADPSSRSAKRLSRESPYTSPADENQSRARIPYSPRPNQRPSQDSPHTSSADESQPKRHSQDSSGLRPRRVSTHRRERPRLDDIGQHYSYGGGEFPEDRHENRVHRKDPSHPSVYDGRAYLEPSSLRSPKAMEDYLEMAFKDHSARNLGKPARSPSSASPRASPPGTPPRTPRADRRSKDYFASGSTIPSQPTIPHSRQASKDEGYFRDLKPLTSIVTAAGAAKVAPGFLGNSSRSSTSSVERHPSDSGSKSSSGRRSRNSSPQREDPQPVSRSASFARIDPRPISRVPTFPLNDGRPVSRTASYAPQMVESPRPIPRAFSYSSADDATQMRQGQPARPVQTTYIPVTVTETLPSPTMPRMVRSSPSSSEKVPTAALSTPSTPNLPPCPRSKPVAGFRDWWTIRDLHELDICPSCMGSVGNSRFRDSFVPSAAKPATQPVQCALSKPWVRLAWLQIMKQHRRSLDVLSQLIRLPPATRPCPGRKSELRSWYRIIDPDTGTPVPNFEACSACVRGVELVFPQLKGTLKRETGLFQERTCDLTCESKRFEGYMNQFELAARKYEVERLREPNIHALADHARRTARVRECARDDKVVSEPWHFMPQLPEFTICEECFQDVVWPIVDKPIAKNINRTLQFVPGTREGRPAGGNSCQLYSERMRKTFLEAVRYNDFDLLKSVALRRYGVEQLVQEKHQLYMKDMAQGKDRTMELQENIEKWKQFE